MERAELRRYLQAGMSVAEIGEAVGRHPSTVSYWLQRNGLKANGAERHRARGPVRRDDLSRFVEAGMTVREIAVRLGRSQTNVRYWIERHGLPSPIDVRRRDRDASLAQGSRTVERSCPKHGPGSFVVENSGRVRCRKCRQANVSRWRRRVKRRLIEEAGGRCVLCGYDGFPGALEFHHLDPGEKAFGLSARGVARSFDELRREAEKCALLCANCHAEVEGGVRKLPLK